MAAGHPLHRFMGWAHYIAVVRVRATSQFFFFPYRPWISGIEYLTAQGLNAPTGIKPNPSGQ